MSGPIVRTGATPKFWENWDQVFGKGKKTAKKSPASVENKPAAKAKAAPKKKGK